MPASVTGASTGRASIPDAFTGCSAAATARILIAGAGIVRGSIPASSSMARAWIPVPNTNTPSSMLRPSWAFSVACWSISFIGEKPTPLNRFNDMLGEVRVDWLTGMMSAKLKSGGSATRNIGVFAAYLPPARTCVLTLLSLGTEATTPNVASATPAWTSVLRTSVPAASTGAASCKTASVVVVFLGSCPRSCACCGGGGNPRSMATLSDLSDLWFLPKIFKDFLRSLVFM